MLRKLILALGALVCLSLPASAATCFWVGGTGSWSTSNTTSWASSTGGSGGTCAATGGIPKQSADTATFDANSGTGTVTLDATMSGTTITNIVFAGYGGTFDFTSNSYSMTLAQIQPTGTGTRTIALGDVTLNLTGANVNTWDCSSCGTVTFTGSAYTINFVNPSNLNTQNFVGGGKTYSGTFSVGSRTNGSLVSVIGNNTFATLNLTCPAAIIFPNSGTQTINNAVSWAGTSSSASQCFVGAAAGTTTLAFGASSTASWVGFRGIIGSTSNLTVTNGFDFGSNSGTISITQPSVGGGGKIIGG